MDIEEILAKVAAGELTPDQALPLLDAAAGAPSPGPGAAEPAAGDTSPAWGTAESVVSGAATTVRVNAAYRPVEVIADPTVAQVVVTGNHTVRREGGVLIVAGQEIPFAAEPGERGSTSFSFADLPRTLAWAKSWTEQRLVVRVNPELPVELDTAGASVTVNGLEGGVRLRLVASALKLDRVRGPIDLDAMSSSVKGFVAPTGTSRLSSESSSVKLRLGPGSDVRITARNRMGKVVLPTAVSKGGLVDPEVTESVVGAGHGTLRVEAVMSSVVLTQDEA